MGSGTGSGVGSGVGDGVGLGVVTGITTSVAGGSSSVGPIWITMVSPYRSSRSSRAACSSRACQSASALVTVMDTVSPPER